VGLVRSLLRRMRMRSELWCPLESLSSVDALAMRCYAKC
jgi:hypothetical protein